MRLSVLAALLLVSNSLAAAEPRAFFPDDPCVINVKKHCGAVGDGKADDTAALQKALDESCGVDAAATKVVFIPDGTYRLTSTLVCNTGRKGSGLGPWLYGETRDGVVLRLDDGVKGCTSVLRTHPDDEGAKSSANWFMRNVRNLTIDIGDNPETDGIRYVATNTGIIQNVRIKGNGKIGINAAFLGESGPNLVQDVEISGCEIGVKSAWQYGMTLSRVTIRDCRQQGVYVVANVIGIEDLVVENTPQALFIDYPNDWHWWSGVVALVGGKFSTTNSKLPAIRNRGELFARDVTATGFARVLESSTPGGNVDGDKLDEYASHAAKKLFDNAPSKSLRLPVKREPMFAWEANATQWVCANDFGATAEDKTDDTAAIQKAIDTAARQGKTTVYLRGVSRRADPNWYTLEGEVHVHGSVRHVLGLGFGRVLGGRFIVDDKSATLVKFQNFDSFGGPPPTFENRSLRSTMIVESVGGIVIGRGQGDIFVTDLAGNVHLENAGQSLWARHLNPEGTSDTGLVTNRGGNLWIMGTKSEGKGLHFLTSHGGKTEIFGAYEYTTDAVEDDDHRPMFAVEDAAMTLAAMREVCFSGKPYPVLVRAQQGKTTRELKKGEPGPWVLTTEGE